MYPNPEAKEMYELGVKDGADLAWMHGSDATAHELEKAYFQGMDEAMKKRDVQPIVHGRWININNSQRLVCSVCSHEQINPHNYCPTCGAKMDTV